MRAAVLRAGQIVVDDIGELPVLPGHVLLETIACGICGSDLHARTFGHEMVDAAKATGFDLFIFDADADIVMGHEFAGRVLEVGAGVEGITTGTPVVAHPIALPGGSLKRSGTPTRSPGHSLSGCWCTPVASCRSRRRWTRNWPL
jgi:threonine dehydrogenase-like Zn-dependent dehydrogenase